MSRRKRKKSDKRAQTHVTSEDSGVAKSPPKCFICTNEHQTKDCPTFIATNDKIALLCQHKICIYCVKHKYDRQKPCKSRPYLKCGICSKQHITETHPLPAVTAATGTPNAPNSLHSAVMPTALVTIIAYDHVEVKVRALLDDCSNRTYICESLVQKMQLRKNKSYINVTGVGGLAGVCRSTVRLSVKISENEQITTTALVVPKVTSSQHPAQFVEAPRFSKISPLADPSWNQPAPTQILFGLDVAAQLKEPQIKKQKGFILQKTVFGWTVYGGTDPAVKRSPLQAASVHVCSSEYENDIIKMFHEEAGQSDTPQSAYTHVSATTADARAEQQLFTFWDMPFFPGETAASDDDRCEKLFKTLHYQREDKRYVVPLLWKECAPALGNSYSKAIKFFLAQETRLEKNSVHKQKSDAFMREYINLGHMEVVPDAERAVADGSAYYIPYFSVIRDTALTTKLRNVFNASSPSDNGVSLNDLLLTGPKLQTMIFDIITRSRQFKYIYCSDAEKMFRQIEVLPADRSWQRIVWREDKSQPLMEYKLSTLTYGLDSSPYLAQRVFHQIADDHAPNDKIRNIIKTCFYVDDSR